MQAIGGVKGSQAYYFNNLQQQSNNLMNPLISKYIPKSLLPSVNATLPGLVDLPLGDPSTAGLKKYGLNLRDNIPQGDTEGIPLQFILEPANCRIFYTEGQFSVLMHYGNRFMILRGREESVLGEAWIPSSQTMALMLVRKVAASGVQHHSVHLPVHKLADPLG
jgi:hypothetical protein